VDLTVVGWVARVAFVVRRRAASEQLAHRVLMSVADTNGRAAARALADAHNSSDPYGERQQAVMLLRSSFESYLNSAESTPSGVTRMWPWAHRRAAADARFNAALCALAIARIYHVLRNRRQKRTWRDLAHDNFVQWNGLSPSLTRRMPENAQVLLGPGDDEEPSDETSGVEREPVARVRRAFEDDCAELYPRGRRSRLVWDQPADCVA